MIGMATIFFRCRCVIMAMSKIYFLLSVRHFYMCMTYNNIIVLGSSRFALIMRPCDIGFRTLKKHLSENLWCPKTYDVPILESSAPSIMLHLIRFMTRTRVDTSHIVPASVRNNCLPAFSVGLIEICTARACCLFIFNAIHNFPAIWRESANITESRDAARIWGHAIKQLLKPPDWLSLFYNQHSLGTNSNPESPQETRIRWFSSLIMKTVQW